MGHFLPIFCGQCEGWKVKVVLFFGLWSLETTHCPAAVEILSGQLSQLDVKKQGHKNKQWIEHSIVPISVNIFIMPPLLTWHNNLNAYLPVKCKQRNVCLHTGLA